MKKLRSLMTRRHSRTEKTIRAAQLSDRPCYVWLHIADGMEHTGIQDELCEDFMRVYQRITFPTVEIPGEMPCIRSERTGCIAPEDATIVDGELRDVVTLKQPRQSSSLESKIWHFAGGIWLVGHETCFCEYDANKRAGGMMIFFDGQNIPRLLEKYPQLKPSIKIAKPDQYDWLMNNW